MSSSQVNYADERFYQDSFGEIQDFGSEANTFPVKVVTLRIGWIMKTQDGQDYLNEILHSEDLEYYKIKSLQMLIEFLYSRFK